jgi:hypothetical protein
MQLIARHYYLQKCCYMFTIVSLLVLNDDDQLLIQLVSLLKSTEMPKLELAPLSQTLSHDD